MVHREMGSFRERAAATGIAACGNRPLRLDMRHGASGMKWNLFMGSFRKVLFFISISPFAFGPRSEVAQVRTSQVIGASDFGTTRRPASHPGPRLRPGRPGRARHRTRESPTRSIPTSWNISVARQWTSPNCPGSHELEQALFTCSVRNRVFPGGQKGLAATLDRSVL